MNESVQTRRPDPRARRERAGLEANALFYSALQILMRENLPTILVSLAPHSATCQVNARTLGVRSWRHNVILRMHTRQKSWELSGDSEPEPRTNMGAFHHTHGDYHRKTCLFMLRWPHFPWNLHTAWTSVRGPGRHILKQWKTSTTSPAMAIFITRFPGKVITKHLEEVKEIAGTSERARGGEQPGSSRKRKGNTKRMN